MKRTVKRGGKFIPQYRLKWVGYPDIWNEWYEKDQLENCIDMVEQFEREQQEKEERTKQKLTQQQGTRKEKGLPRRRGRPRKQQQPTQQTEEQDVDNDRQHTPQQEDNVVPTRPGLRTRQQTRQR